MTDHRPHRRRYGPFILLGWMVAYLCGCGGAAGESDPSTIAMFKDRALTREQLDRYMPDGLQPEDSARFADQFVERWIREQAVMDRALKENPDLTKEVEYKVEDYRAKLIMHEYHSKLTDQDRILEVPRSELEAYYETNKDNFRSKQAHYSYFFLVTTEKSGLDKVARLMRSREEEDISNLKAWAGSHTLEYKLDSLYSDENRINTISKGYFGNLRKASVGQLIRWNGVIQGVRRRYMFKMLDVVNVGEHEPLSLCEAKIKSLLMNERQVKLIDETEQKIIKDAEENNYIQR